VGLLVAIIQTGLVFFAGQVLQASTAQAARQIMTGQAQAQGVTAAQFQQAVCNNAAGLFTCGNLSVNVQTFTSFSSMTRLNPVQNGAINPALLSFQPGIAGNIEMVQVYYPWPVGQNIFGIDLANVGGNSSLLIATSVFRNEPY
jgi:Flp pilus assembly protein TadG